MHRITSKGCFLTRYSHQNLSPLPHLFWLILSHYHITNSKRLCFYSPVITHDLSACGRLLMQHRERAKQQMRPIFKKLRNWCKTSLTLWWCEALQVSPAELEFCFGSLLPYPPSNRNRIAHTLMVSRPDLSFQRINWLSLLRGMNSCGIPALHCAYGQMLSIKWPSASSVPTLELYILCRVAGSWHCLGVWI